MLINNNTSSLKKGGGATDGRAFAAGAGADPHHKRAQSGTVGHAIRTEEVRSIPQPTDVPMKAG